MIKRFAPVALAGIAILNLTACKNDSFKTTKDGLEYRIVKDEKGDKKPAVGDMVQMHIHIRYKDKTTDTTLFDSRTMNGNMPVEFPIMPAAFKGDWPEGVLMMTAGDSAVFRVSVDSVKKISQGTLPAFMKDKEKIEYDVVLVSIKSRADSQKEQEAQSARQKDIDDKLIQDYLAQNNINATKTASGIYYTIEKEGTGDLVKTGQTAIVNYTGKTLDGNPFDSNVDPKFQHVEPFSFVVGQGQVIPGWDEGLTLLKKGSKAKLYIPSTLAYGPQSPGPGIEPNSVLMFEVEVTDVK